MAKEKGMGKEVKFLLEIHSGDQRLSVLGAAVNNTHYILPCLQFPNGFLLSSE